MLYIQRPNAQKTGAALEVWPHPGNAITLKLYQQKQDEDIAYADPIKTTLYHEDIALMLMVLLGYEESILNGKGIIHHCGSKSTRIGFRHILEPLSGYELEIALSKTCDSKTEIKRRRIILQPQDALALSYGIQGVLSASLTE